MLQSQEWSMRPGGCSEYTVEGIVRINLPGEFGVPRVIRRTRYQRWDHGLNLLPDLIERGVVKPTPTTASARWRNQSVISGQSAVPHQAVRKEKPRVCSQDAVVPVGSEPITTWRLGVDHLDASHVLGQ